MSIIIKTYFTLAKFIRALVTIIHAFIFDKVYRKIFSSNFWDIIDFTYRWLWVIFNKERKLRTKSHEPNYKKQINRHLIWDGLLKSQNIIFYTYWISKSGTSMTTECYFSKVVNNNRVLFQLSARLSMLSPQTRLQMSGSVRLMEHYALYLDSIFTMNCGPPHLHGKTRDKSGEILIEYIPLKRIKNWQ